MNEVQRLLTVATVQADMLIDARTNWYLRDKRHKEKDIPKLRRFAAYVLWLRSFDDARISRAQLRRVV